MRTTLDIDDPVLKELKRLKKAKGTSLGRLVSDLLAKALQEEKRSSGKPAPAVWISREMGARVDLLDKDALHAALDKGHSTPGQGSDP